MLFQSSYRIAELDENIQAIAVSDCVISWARNGAIKTIVDFVSSLHAAMIGYRLLMQTAIAHGEFRYERRIELSNLQKGMMVGGAYVSAFLEHHKVIEGGIVLVGEDSQNNSNQDDWKWQKSRKPTGWEYFWSANSSDKVSKIVSARKDADKAKYECLKDIYQGQFDHPVLTSRVQRRKR
jgi:hypothetical protein